MMLSSAAVAVRGGGMSAMRLLRGRGCGDELTARHSESAVPAFLREELARSVGGRGGRPADDLNTSPV